MGLIVKSRDTNGAYPIKASIFLTKSSPKTVEATKNISVP